MFKTVVKGNDIYSFALKGCVYIAASDANDYEKAYADYVCDGSNDMTIIQNVVDYLCPLGGGVIKLSSGSFKVTNFSKSDGDNALVALLLPSNTTFGYELRIEGTTLPYGDINGGTRIVVTDDCYESLEGSQQYKIISFVNNNCLPGVAQSSVVFTDFLILLPWNQKKIMCIDLRSCNRPYLARLSLRGYTSGYRGGWVTSITVPPAVAVEGCVGIRFTNGSNYGTLNDYLNIGVTGFYEGFAIGGEHVVASNLSAIFCVYGYTFGNYPWASGFNHPITLINCCDERNVNLPLFNTNGDGGSNSGQEVTFIDFNIERIAAFTPGKVLGDYMKELHPGIYHGTIEYTIQTQYGGQALSTTMQLWEHGSGHGFVSRNVIQKMSCDSTTRLSYTPNYLQHIYDTTLNKEVICIDTENKTWVDCNGNVVD